MYQHILVPLDDSDLAVALAAEAVRFAKSCGARITFFHARADFSATSDGAVMHAMAPDEFEERQDGGTGAVIARAQAEARFHNVRHEIASRTSDRPYEAILDTAAERGCDLIFMASHGRKGVRSLLIGSQTSKVLSHTTLPVLVATVQANRPGADMEAAISILKGEHRSLAAVMHCLRHNIELARAEGGVVDGVLLRAAVRYFQLFTAGMHHPKEETYIFTRLRAHAALDSELLAKLEHQHNEEGDLITAVESAVDAYLVAPAAETLAGLGQAVEAYASHLWEHMNLEEKFVLPACQAALSAADWAEIVKAFRDNGDPRFDRAKAEGFDRLMGELLNFGRSR